MSLPAAFRLSFFATLALACGCLGAADSFFLWWMWIFVGATLVLLAVAYRTAGRWVLNATAANCLGLVIALSAFVWVLANVPRDEAELFIGDYSWPAGLLPFLGPLLMVLFLT